MAAQSTGISRMCWYFFGFARWFYAVRVVIKQKDLIRDLTMFFFIIIFLLCIICLCTTGQDCNFHCYIVKKSDVWCPQWAMAMNSFSLSWWKMCVCVSQREGHVEVGIMTASTQATDERVQEWVSSRPSLDPSRECSYSPSISPLFFTRRFPISSFPR